MSQQPVIRHAYAETAGNPPQKYGDRQSFPAKEEKGGNGPDMKHDHEKSGQLADWFPECAVIA
jgi:hypothetical protein